MPYPNEHAARLRDPGDFQETTFRSKELKGGIRLIVAMLKGKMSMTAQAYRFSADKFTVEEAKKWLEDHKIKFIKFEPASGGSMDNKVEHAGIKGMKWGQRNKRDMPGETGGKTAKTAATTPEIKKRNMPGETGGKKPKQMSGDAKEVATLKAKKAHELSNEELQKVSKRMELEKKFKELNPSKLIKGKKKVEGIFSTVSKTAGVIGSVGVLVVTGKKLMDFALAHPKVVAKATKTAEDWVI